MPPQPVGKGSYGHTQEQLLERYGLTVRPERLARKIKEGKATLLSYGAPGSGRLIYSVPMYVYGEQQEPVWVKVVYAPAGNGAIITVLPPLWKRELHREEIRERKERAAQSKKRFARDFRRVNADEDDF